MNKKHIKYDNWSKDELIKELKRIKETTYGLVWHRDVPQEKIDVLINPDACTPEEMFANEVVGKPFPVLKEVKSKEVVSDKKDQTHILIEGDNYHSLAVLNFTHQEAIDVIYIDPPYNTGNDDFIYTDKYKSDYVIKDDPFRHSKWLTFMDKRLKLSKNLLKKDGVIFISIDDNEQAQLKLLCDEIFGSNNFIGEFIWQKQGNDNKSIFSGTNTFRNDHEFIVVYAKESQSLKFNRPEEDAIFQNDYGNVDNDSRGNWMSAELGKSDKRSLQHGKNYFTLKSPTGVEWTRQWHYSEKEIQDLINNNRIYFGKNGDSVPRLKKFLSDKVQKVPSSLLLKQGSTKVGIEEITKLFDGQRPFDYPKPTELIKYILQLHVNKSATILDFFAGSGTTGQAVLQLNKGDGGKRHFILCTNNENNICTEVCYPRITKVIKGYKDIRGEKVKGLGGNLKYYTAYDFVESEPSDKNKHKLVNKCTEMLCIKEGIYDPVTETNDYKIFKSHTNRYLGIIFYEDAIDEYKKAIKKINKSINTYVFSLGDDPHTSQFADVMDKVVLQAIPEIILKVYQEIFR